VRHVYECPLRWADLDLLGHVNNVTYVDYLQEARVDLMRRMLPVAPGVGEDLTEGVVVVRHEVGYVEPLTFDLRPVRIECWVTRVRAASFTLAYEVVRDESATGGAERVVHLRASTVLTPFVFADERPRRLSPEERAALEAFGDDGPAEPGQVRPGPTPPVPAVDRGAATRFGLQVRFTDVDLYRHVNNVRYFEYFQEARIRLFTELLDGPGGAGAPPLSVVVAQTDVDYRSPILLRPEPYDVWTQVARVGRRSLTLVSQVDDGEQSLARARVTLVFWDRERQTSTDPDPALRALLESRVSPRSC